MTKKKSTKRELLEWGIFFGVLIGLYATGLHAPLLGGVQSLLLKTGLMRPNLLPTQAQYAASYELQLLDLEGNAVDMRTLKGKVIFLNFWATWCPPCLAEMPEIVALYERTPPEEVVFLMISVDKDVEKLRKFAEKKAYPFPVYRLAGGLPASFEASTIPTTYVVSPLGKVVVHKVGMGSYNTEAFRETLRAAAAL